MWLVSPSLSRIAASFFDRMSRADSTLLLLQATRAVTAAFYGRKERERESKCSYLFAVYSVNNLIDLVAEISKVCVQEVSLCCKNTPQKLTQSQKSKLLHTER